MSSVIEKAEHVSLVHYEFPDNVEKIEEKNLTNIIFLPFNEYWELLVIITIITNYLLCLHNAAFDAPYRIISEIVYYLCEFLYAIDTICIIAHRCMPKIRKLRHYLKKHIALITISVVSLIPFGELYSIRSFYGWQDAARDYERFIPIFIRLKCALRLFRIYIYFHEKRNGVFQKRLLIVIFQQFVLIFLLSSSLSAIWYRLSCWRCGRRNWADTIDNPVFDHANLNNWVIICWYTVASVFAHTWPGYIIALTFFEKIFLIVCMQIGFLLHSMFFFGQLTVEYLQLYRSLFEFKARMNKIVYLLNDWEVDKRIKSRAMEYYRVFWHRRYGIKDMPAAFKFLPTSLQKEITLDIFWEFIRHSHMLRDTDISFKRTITLAMKTSFLLPGDYLFKINDHKTSMIYITSGIVTLLSEEDDESPIMSLSGGTLLGDMACLLNVKCAVNIRCETYCEIQTLTLPDMCKVLVNHPHVKRALLNQLHDRINYVKWVKSDAVPKADLERNFKEDKMTIKTLKRQWKYIFKMNRSKKVDDSDWKRLNRCFTSDYLDTLVLSDNVEQKLEVVCLTSKCPFIMDPDSSFRHFLEYVDIAAVLLQAAILPYPIFFLRTVHYESYLTIHLILNICYIFDIYWQLTTALIVGNKLTTKFTNILLYRLKQTNFIVDVIASVPYHTILDFFDMSDRFTTLFEISRFFKFYKIFAFIAKKEQQVSVNYLYIRLVKYIIVAIFLTYWCCCILYASSCFYEECYPDRWFSSNAAQGKQTYQHRFARSLFYSISLVLNVNISDNCVYSVEDMILIIIIIYLGYMTYSCCFAELAASAIAQMQNTYDHQEQISTFSAIMKRRSVNKELRNRLLNIIEFSWMYNEGAQIYGDDGILSEASAELRSEIINDRIIECLKLTPAFNDSNAMLLKKFSLQTEVIILPAETVILNTNVTSNYIYVIIRGFCRMNSELPGDIERNSSIILKRGDMLAPIETFHRLRMFGRIISLTAVELLCITYTAFIDILQSSRSDFLHFQTALEQHMKVFESILTRKGSRLPNMKPLGKTLGKTETFVYHIEKEKTYTHSKDYYYNKPFKDLGIYSFVKYFLLRRTINPRGVFYIVWEICRCLITFFDIAVCIIFLSFPPDIMKIMSVVLNVVHSICILDLYVRLHCQYYTDDGVLVTHPLLTASHYIKTSFLIDAISIAPFGPMGVTALFGRDYVLITITVVRLFIRPLQLYRFFSAVSLVESVLYGTTGSLVLKTKTIFLLIIILGITANVVIILSCDLTGNLVNCKQSAWFTNSYFRDARKETHLAFIHTVYFAFSLFAHTLCGVFTAVSAQNLKLFVAMSFLSFIYRTWILATFTSSGIGSNTRLADYHTREKWFLKFSKQNQLDERIVKETVQHYTHVWKESFGINIGDIAGKFNVYLRIQFILSLYEETLKNSQILADAPTPVLQQFVLGVKEQHFQRGASIIRCNDVQDMLYFVYRGKVDVCVANTVLSTLGCGAIFGCFNKKGITRQTITVIAQTHTTVLALKSNKLHQFLEEWQDEYTETYIKNIRLLNIEFLKSKRKERVVSDVRFAVDNLLTTKYSRMVFKLNEYIKFDSKWYQIYNYILNVHLAPISSTIIMANLCINMWSRSNPVMLAFIYVVDVLFLLKIFLSMTLYYIDIDTGLQVRDPKKIFMRYLKTDLILHLLTNLQLELILWSFLKEYTKLGTSNRILRIIYFHKYYNYCIHNLSATRYLAWINLIYRAIFEIQVVASLWFFAACFRHNCKKSVLDDKNRPLDVTVTTDFYESVIYGYSYVINLFTNSGFRDVIPSSLLEIFASIVIAILCQFIVVTLSTGYTNIILVENIILFNFQHKVLRLMKFLRNHCLSAIISENIWTYFLELWKRDYGVWLPSLIVNAPSYLKQDIMYHLYGHHLESHVLFEKTHKHFIRQLVTFLERRIYLSENIIVEKGDVDSCMFFVHSGEVGAYEKHGTNEFLSFVLQVNMSFGMEEGLYGVPYKMTYKAITTVEVLFLKRNRWEYLLEWFPASAEELKAKANECGYKSHSQLLV